MRGQIKPFYLQKDFLPFLSTFLGAGFFISPVWSFPCTRNVAITSLFPISLTAWSGTILDFNQASKKKKKRKEKKRKDNLFVTWSAVSFQCLKEDRWMVASCVNFLKKSFISTSFLGMGNRCKETLAFFSFSLSLFTTVYSV